MCGSADLIVRVRVRVWYDMVSHPIASDLIYVNMEMIHLYSVSTVLSVVPIAFGISRATRQSLYVSH